MATEAIRVANAEAWILGGGVDAAATDLHPNFGPVWVSWHNPNYTSFVERFETASHAADEMWRRCGDRYYPMWYQTEALVYGAHPDDHDGEPLATLTLTDAPYGGTTVVLS